MSNNKKLAILIFILQLCLIKLISSQSTKLSKIRTRGKWYIDEVGKQRNCGSNVIIFFQNYFYLRMIE